MRNFLKLTALVLALCMVLAVPVSAAEDGTCGESLRWSFENGTLTISGTGAMDDFDGPDDRPWIHLYDRVTAIVLEEGVTTIGNWAFNGMRNAASLTLPATLEHIGLFAFIGCEQLTELDLPQGLQSIGQQAFYLCTGLTDVTIPGTVTFLDAGIFDGCTSLKRAYIEKSSAGVFVNGSAIFRGCTALEEITVEDGHCALKSIDGVLYNYDDQGLTLLQYPLGMALEELTLPEGTLAINQFGLEYAPVGAITFPWSFTGFSDFALSSCPELKTLTFKGDAPYFSDTALWGNLLTIRYPADNDTWNAGMMLDYGGFSVVWESYTLEEEKPEPEPETPFLDVPQDSFFEEPVAWAVKLGITTGVSDDAFGPYGKCQRAQVVTFLWRAAGKPEPVSTENPFVDVKESDFFYKAVLWAVENGITTGSDATHFGPYGKCNRAQVVTFLWRAAGEPEPVRTENPFVDVKGSDFFHKAVLWALESGVTTGMDAAHFSPYGVCNRAQVVTFLYRAFH